MSNVTSYGVLFYGGTVGYDANGPRVQIQLMSGSSTGIGWVRFYDLGKPIPVDTNVGGQIAMHLPITVYPYIIDLLRNEKPINYIFSANKAFLGTSTNLETVGERDV